MALAVLAWVGGSVERPSVPDELFREASTQGHVRVIVKIARDEAAGESVAAAQNVVLASLAGTDYQLLHRYINSAFLALEVGPDALAALARAPKVESVAADLPLRSPVPGRIP